MISECAAAPPRHGRASGGDDPALPVSHYIDSSDASIPLRTSLTYRERFLDGVAAIDEIGHCDRQSTREAT
jgi:hypothetical protein